MISIWNELFLFPLILKELQSFEVPQLLTLVDGLGQGMDNQICVGYKNQFDLINEKNGDTLQLHQSEAAKVSLKHNNTDNLLTVVQTKVNLSTLGKL